MKLPRRSSIAMMLAVIYALVIMSPLVERALRSQAFAHAVTGECTGDCSTCGCSTESMATRSCCCMKKQQQAKAHEEVQDGTPDCCKRGYGGTKVVIASCGCPCGGGKHAVLSGCGTSELLPCYFTTRFSIPVTDTIFPVFAGVIISCQVAPPDPPPKIS